MTTHQLDLLENALDSLGEALEKFEVGDQGDHKSYKFAVLHMAHFIELIFKYHIAQKHPLLIYQNPFSQKLDRNKTIGLWEAVNFINNEASDTISAKFRSDLEWLKRLRNEIEHHKFVMEVPQVRTTIGRLFRSVLDFLADYTDIDIESQIPKRTMEVFKVLSDEYEFRRNDAIREADQIELNDESYDPMDPNAEPIRFDCESCENPTFVRSKASPTGFKCTFCGNEEGDEIPSICSSCGAPTARGDLVFWENEMGESEGRCYYCSGRYRAEKDD